MFFHKEETIMRNRVNVRKIVMTAMLSAVSAVLMMLSFSVPFMPSYLKLDFSELPALIAAFSMGPVSGVAVCLIKNLINVLSTTTGGVGELSNFLLGCLFVIPAGLIYQNSKSRKSALIASLVGTLVMTAGSLATNYYLVYPFYAKVMPIEVILNMYSAILPGVNTLLAGLVVFNMPFTFLKGLLDVILTFLIYKRISPFIKGTWRATRAAVNE